MHTPPRNKPVYIALEGLDGTGKSTLFGHLAARFEKEGISYTTLCPTRMTRPKSLVERLYNFHMAHRRVPLFRRIIFAYRSYCATRLVDPSASLILGDRSIASSYAKNWQAIFRSRSLSILLFDIIEPFIPTPDYILLLQASPGTIAERLRPRAYVDVDEVPAVQERMRKAYEEMSTTDSVKRLKKTRWITVDADKPEEILADEVFTMIKEIIFTAQNDNNERPDTGIQ